MSAIPWIGQDIVEFLWGGFSVNNATLNRFFALHFVLPFILAALALMHLIALHDSAGFIVNFYSTMRGNHTWLPYKIFYSSLSSVPLPFLRRGGNAPLEQGINNKLFIPRYEILLSGLI